jgi:hypothetical protein
MTLGAAASNPASKGPGGPQCLLPRSPRTRLTLRRVAWLAGIDAPCTALRATLRPLGPRPPRVCPAAPAGVPRGPRGASHACGRGAPCWPQELAARLRCFAERGVGAGARSGPESTRKVSSSAAGSACGPESVSANSECDCASLLWRVSFGTTAVSGSNQIRQSGHPSAGLRRFKRAGANLRGSGASPSVRER